jgi:hypothetical protein
MIIDSAGYVGIGIARGGTDPRASLDVCGENSGYDGTIRIGERTIIEARDAGSTTTSIVNTYDHDSAKFNIRLKDVADADAQFTVEGNGNVGIGVAAPASKVHILGGSNNTVSQANAILNIEGAGGNGVVIGNMVASTYGSYLQAGYVEAPILPITTPLPPAPSIFKIAFAWDTVLFEPPNICTLDAGAATPIPTLPLPSTVN